MLEDYLEEKLDDIEMFLAKKDWIVSWQVFLHSIKSVGIKTFEEKTEQIVDSLRIGGAIRIITRRKQLMEENFSISEISDLNQLKEPSSTSERTQIDNFPSLKVPNTSSISGDFANSVDMDASPYMTIIENALQEATDFNIPFSHFAEVELENRIIKNSNSIKLNENSLRCNYEVATTFGVHDHSYHISRNIAGRTIALETEPILRDLVNSSNSRISDPLIKIPDDPAILFHPEVIGKLISFYYSNLSNQVITLDELGEIQWDDNIQLYDDPLRSNGYFSTLFDDEGSLTRPKQLISEGRASSLLTDLTSSNGEKGGNGFRVEWFQPNIRSYQFNLKPAISNLVLTGGTGKGKYFTDRPGDLVLIRKGHGYPTTGTKSGEFVFQVHEADLYNNGTYVSPLHNFSIAGNINTIMKKGQLSSDELVVIDPTFPGSIYSSWLVIPPSTVTLRS